MQKHPAEHAEHSLKNSAEGAEAKAATSRLRDEASQHMEGASASRGLARPEPKTLEITPLFKTPAASGQQRPSDSSSNPHKGGNIVSHDSFGVGSGGKESMRSNGVPGQVPKGVSDAPLTNEQRENARQKPDEELAAANRLIGDGTKPGQQANRDAASRFLGATTQERNQLVQMSGDNQFTPGVTEVTNRMAESHAFRAGAAVLLDRDLPPKL